MRKDIFWATKTRKNILKLLTEEIIVISENNPSILGKHVGNQKRLAKEFKIMKSCSYENYEAVAKHYDSAR